MNPDTERTRIEPSTDFIKELDTKEVLTTPTPVQPSPFNPPESPQATAPIVPTQSQSTAPSQPTEPVLDTVIHHTSRPLEAPMTPKPEEEKQKKVFKVSSLLITIFASATLLWGLWCSYSEIRTILLREELQSSMTMQAYIPAALAVIAVFASIGMLFKKDIARIVYLGVAFGYVCLAIYYGYNMATLLNSLGTNWTNIFSVEFLTGFGKIITIYLLTGIAATVFLFNKHIRAAFWR